MTSSADPTEAVLLAANPTWSPLSAKAKAAIRRCVEDAPEMTELERRALVRVLRAGGFFASLGDD